MRLKPTLQAACACVALLTACDDGAPAEPAGVQHDLARLIRVLETNAAIAHAAYGDAVAEAGALKAAIEALIAAPSAETLATARRAWLVAREPYGQTEVYRFRASPIDDTDDNAANGEDGPEGDINAWPLGEALIDYVVQGGDFGIDEVGVSAHQTGVADPIPGNNLINSLDVTLDAALLANSATAEDEHDVIAGYHAVEFLLWGQDLNADGSVTDGDRSDAVKVHSFLEANGALTTHGGQRPASDFDATDGQCTSGAGHVVDAEICTRRGQYLLLVTDKLIADLTQVRDAWAPGAPFREAFTKPADEAAAKHRLLQILTGMGTLSEGELAGERMQISLAANSQEDEHSCFSDNTHRDIWLNAEGVANSFFGDYAGYDSTLDGQDDATARAVSGYGVDDYLRDLGQGELADQVAAALEATRANYTALDAKARAGMPVDVLITRGSSEDAKPMRDTIVSLNAQSALIARVAVDLELGDAAQVVDPDASACDTTDPTAECP